MDAAKKNMKESGKTMKKGKEEARNERKWERINGNGYEIRQNRSQ